MKNVIFKIVVILTPVLLLGLVVEAVYETEPGMYHEKSQFLKQSGNDLDVLFMGNSSMYSAVIPDLVHARSYNLGLPAEPPIRSLQLALHLSYQLENLQTVVIGLNYTSLFVSEDIKTKDDRNYLHFFGLPPKSVLESMSAFFSAPPDQIVYQLKDKLLSFNSNHTESEQIWIATGKGHYYREFQPVNLEELSYNMIRNQTLSSSVDNLEDNIDQISWYMEKLESRGVRIILLRLPTYSAYYRLQDEEWVMLHDQAVSRIQESCNYCDYIDYSHDTSFQQGAYYFDPFHMSLDGAKAFSVDLKNRLFKD